MTSPSEKRWALGIAAIAFPLCLGVYALQSAVDYPAPQDDEAIWVSAIAARGDRVNSANWQTYRAHYNLGRTQLIKGKYLEAAQHFRLCIDRAPRGSSPWCLSCVMMGVLAERIGEPEKAGAFWSLYMSEANPLVLDARTAVPGAWEMVRRNRAAAEAKE